MNSQSRNFYRFMSLLAVLSLSLMFAPASRSAAHASAISVATVMKPAAPAAPAVPSAAPVTPAAAAAPDEPTAPAAPAQPDEGGNQRGAHRHGRHSHDDDSNDDDGDNHNDVVNIGGNSTLAAGEHADNVVSVLGSSTSAGEVSQAVVSVMGNTRVTGPVGENAVAVLGDVYVDSTVGGDVVAVLGNVQLGPHADIGGNLVAVGGTTTRDPAARVHGRIQDVGSGDRSVHFEALHPWIQHCLRYGRPLAFSAGVGWAWTLALVALAVYVFLGLLLPTAIDQCVKTVESHPGASLLTMLLSVVATPILIVVLCITVIGIAAIPFLLLALLMAQIFGKLVMLTWIGRRIIRPSAPATPMHTAGAVLAGGLIVLVLYVVPVLGFIVFKLLGLIGLGVVVYTLLLEMQGRRAVRRAAAVGATGGAGPATGETAAPSGNAEQTASVPPVGAKSRRVNAADAVSLPRAGFWIRMVALLVDVILVAIVLNFVRGSDNLFLLVLAIYGAIMWKLRGSTVGGIIFNLEVVRHDGREMDWSTVIVRALSSFLSLIALGVGFIWIAVDSEHRAWHDKIAGTIVVRVP